MKWFFLYVLLAFIFPLAGKSQATPAQPATQPMNLPKDAPVDVSIEDAKSGNPLNNEIIVFKGRANSTEFQGLSDSTGKFMLRLPSGDTYDIYILGFQDSTSYNVLTIPALKPNQFYKAPFKVDIQFQAPKSFVLQNCNFETSKATLEPDAYSVLDELVDYLNRKQDEKVEIDGYTDNVGKAADNLILSQNRANTVRAYLLTKGIAPDRVTAQGFGMSNPVDDNNTAEGRAENRRIEVKTLDND